MILHLLGMLTCLIIVLVIGYRIWNSGEDLSAKMIFTALILITLGWLGVYVMQLLTTKDWVMIKGRRKSSDRSFDDKKCNSSI